MVSLVTVPAPEPLPEPVAAPALVITKLVDRTRPTTANRLTFQLIVENRGTAAATSVVVTDTFSRAVELQSVTTTAGTCTRAPLVCRIDSLAAGGQAVITIVARAPTAGQLTNGASVTAANGPGAAAAPVSVNVSAARTSLSLRKRAARAHVTAGARSRYAVTVSNRGTNPALTVRVCDTLPAGLTLMSAPGATVRGRTACWRIASLAGRASRTFTIDTRVNDVATARRITNRATAKGTNTRAVAGRASITADPRERRPRGGVTG